jgi:AcrR family transcriptional regulator
MGVPERKARQKETLRQAILDAARDILLNEGYQAFSMRRIASRIEYTPTTIYLHFKDKTDLLFHLCEEVYERVEEILESAVLELHEPMVRLRATMVAYVEFGLSDPDRYRIAFMTNISPNVDTAGFLKPGSPGMHVYELVRRRLRDVLDEVSHYPADEETITQALWASAHGLISLLISHPGFPWVERKRLIETSVDLMMHGLMKETEKERPRRR